MEYSIKDIRIRYSTWNFSANRIVLFKSSRKSRLEEREGIIRLSRIISPSGPLKIRIKVKSPKSEAKQLERKFAESLNVLDKKEKEEKKRKKERKKKAETERCDRACAANVADGWRVELRDNYCPIKQARRIQLVTCARVDFR